MEEGWLNTGNSLADCILTGIMLFSIFMAFTLANSHQTQMFFDAHTDEKSEPKLPFECGEYENVTKSEDRYWHFTMKRTYCSEFPSSTGNFKLDMFIEKNWTNSETYCYVILDDLTYVNISIENNENITVVDCPQIIENRHGWTDTFCFGTNKMIMEDEIYGELVWKEYFNTYYWNESVCTNRLWKVECDGSPGECNEKHSKDGFFDTTWMHEDYLKCLSDCEEGYPYNVSDYCNSTCYDRYPFLDGFQCIKRLKDLKIRKSEDRAYYEKLYDEQCEIINPPGQDCVEEWGCKIPDNVPDNAISVIFSVSGKMWWCEESPCIKSAIFCEGSLEKCNKGGKNEKR